MLRHAQHERKVVSVFNATSVRPELVEGWEVLFSSLLSRLEEAVAGTDE